MLSFKIVTYWSRSGRDCSCKKPKACPAKKDIYIFINSPQWMIPTPWTPVRMSSQIFAAGLIVY